MKRDAGSSRIRQKGAERGGEGGRKNGSNERKKKRDRTTDTWLKVWGLTSETRIKNTILYKVVFHSFTRSH